MRTILTTRELRDAGLSRAGVARSLESGRLIRIRVGHYATRDADPVAVAAVAARCSVTCAAALRRHGVWVLERSIHLRAGIGVHLHDPRPVHRAPGISTDGVDDLPTALSVAARCLPLESLTAVADSVLNRRLLDRAALREALIGTAVGRRAFADSDEEAESGLETFVRLRLRARGIPVETQARIDGVGRVDLLVGRRLVIELDGDAWHSTPEQRERDRRRDNRLRRLGYIVLRFGYRRVIDEWQDALDDIRHFVARREHRRPPHGRTSAAARWSW